VDPLTDLTGGNLLTPRLRLRSWRDEDEPSMLAMSTDPEVMRHFPRVMTPDEVHAFVTRHRALLAAGRPGLYAVERRADRSFVGFVGLAEPRFEASFTPCVEIGWRLVRSAWGQGLATEAAREVLRHAFVDLALDEVVSFTSLGNEPSIAVMRRLGMHRSCEFDHPGVPEGHQVRRHVLYRLSAGEWRDRKGI
jgi:RimJ/RimL family protein N-acetyltransferase